MIDTLLSIPAAEPSAGSVTGLVIFVSIALGVSFVCSVLEAVLLSTSSAFLEAAAEAGSKAAVKMRGLKGRENIDRSISAILTLNTIAHTVGAAGAGAEAAAIFGSEWIGVIGAVLTFLILVVSEIIPKTLGAVYWKGLMPLSAYTTGALVILLYPIVWSCQLLTDLLKPKTAEPTITRSELETLSRLGHQEGTLRGYENRVLSNLLRLGDVQAKDILTPRMVMFALDANKTVRQAAGEQALRFSRIPIYAGNRDEISRFVLRFDILDAAANGREETKLSDLARPLRTVPETISVAQLLNQFIELHEHIFVVIDEYGGTEGIVTLEDSMESLLGSEITDESDPATDMREVARQNAPPTTD